MESFILILIIAAVGILIVSMATMAAAVENIKQASHKKTSAKVLKQDSTEV